jgi:hypothetical protein
MEKGLVAHISFPILIADTLPHALVHYLGHHDIPIVVVIAPEKIPKQDLTELPDLTKLPHIAELKYTIEKLLFVPVISETILKEERITHHPFDVPVRHCCHRDQPEIMTRPPPHGRFFYLFITVIVICSTVANETQSKYGMLASATHRTCGQMATIAQMSVMSTSTMSIEARRLFLIPNWKYVKEKLKMRLSINGSATANESSPFHAL